MTFGEVYVLTFVTVRIAWTPVLWVLLKAITWYENRPARIRRIVDDIVTGRRGIKVDEHGRIVWSGEPAVPRATARVR